MKGKILAAYQSSSNPGREYHIIRGHDGVTYCDCPAWRFNTARTCKHLVDYLGSHAIHKVHNKITYTADTEQELQEAINAAVEELK